MRDILAILVGIAVGCALIPIMPWNGATRAQRKAFRRNLKQFKRSNP